VVGAKLFQFGWLGSIIAERYQIVKPVPFDQRSRTDLLRDAFQQTTFANKRALRLRRICVLPILYSQATGPLPMCWIFCTSLSSFSWKPFHRRIISAVRWSARRTEIFICCVHTTTNVTVFPTFVFTRESKLHLCVAAQPTERS
jgi:hypothetical protein